MLRHIILASVPFAFASLAVPASAQQVLPVAGALSNCNPVTGLTPSGAECVYLTPIDRRGIDTPVGASGAERYETLDTTTLGQTYECNSSAAEAEAAVGRDVALLIEDCGTPLTGGELGELTPFFGTTGAPAPAPVVVATPVPAPVVVAAPAPVVVPATAVVAPAAAVSSVGLGSAGLIFAGVGAAALLGVVAIAASDDDDDDNNATNSTR